MITMQIAIIYGAVQPSDNVLWNVGSRQENASERRWSGISGER